MRNFKASDQPPARVLRWAALGVALIALAAGVGRWSAPDRPVVRVNTPPTVVGIGFVDGVPVGFPATTRGAGDTAAWYETLLAAAGSRPQAQVRALIGRLVADEVRDSLVAQLMPSTAREGNTNITQTVVLRVWATPATARGALPPGTQVRVKILGLGLFGVRTDGASTSAQTGLAGGFVVHDLVMQRTADRWVLREVATPVPAPPPDAQGTLRDGSPRRTEVLAEVLGPDSWIPSMPDATR